MSVRAELYALAARVDAALAPPPLAACLIADPRPDSRADPEFGLLALADGSAGLYYAWLGASQAGMRARYVEQDLVGLSALALAGQFMGGSDAERSVGIAAINALTAHLWRRAGYTPPPAIDSLAGLSLGPGDRLGMIGHFPPLVRYARARGAEVAVVERKAHMVRREPGLEISLDPRVLAGCSAILCTGATLVNDSFEDMLTWCGGATTLALVGPTVGCFPDPLFARGVDIVAGTCVSNASVARERLAQGEKLGDSAWRFVLPRADYPGFETLLSAALQRPADGSV